MQGRRPPGEKGDFCIPTRRGSSFSGFLLLLVQSSCAKPGQQKNPQVQAQWQGYNKTGMVVTWWDAAPTTGVWFWMSTG